MASDPEFDIAIVGGGFYGCALALYLRSVTDRIVVIEAGEGLLERASRVNQARVHTGFHYPRSFVTALRSRILQERFCRDFPDAVVADFDMIYAIAARRSKVSSGRFFRMFENMQAPIARAPPRCRALFDPALIEEAFVCKEVAFDWSVLRDRMVERLARHGVPVRFGVEVAAISAGQERCEIALKGGGSLSARRVFNVTYSNINSILAASGLEPVALKHELAEIALVEPPPEMAGYAMTVMDGPFFSVMPYPSAGLHSLTHVRYTPHYSWIDRGDGRSAYEVAEALPRQTRWRHMMLDARRYAPCLTDVRYERSLFDVKTVLVKNERDDGRPILLNRQGPGAQVYSVMGAKIDNIYDLFEALPLLDPDWRKADARHVFE